MNLVPSLFIYNFIESLTIFLWLGIFSKSKTVTKQNIPFIYLYGVVSLAIQYANDILFGSSTYILCNILVTFGVYPIIFMLFCKYFTDAEDMVSAIKAKVMYSLVSLCIVQLMHHIGVVHMAYSFKLPFIIEFIENIIIQLPHLLAVGIIYHKVLKGGSNG